MNISFNTGRRYTAEGQVITALWQPTMETVWFMDHSRGVSGKIEAPEWEIGFTTPGGFAQWVMNRYDRGSYEGCLRASSLTRRPEVHEFAL